MKTTCAHCGTEIDRPPCRLKANPNQFCDHDCHTAFQRKRRVEVACVICGKTKSVAPSQVSASPVCGPACDRIRLSRMRVDYFGTAETRVAVCAQCGKSFTRRPSQLAKYSENFCGRACHAAYKLGKGAPKTGRWVPCEVCGTDVWRTPATEQPHTFCSRLCYSRSGNPRPGHPGPGFLGPTHPLWKGGDEYGIGFTDTVKKRVRQRDGNACRICGLAYKPKSGNLVVHHVDQLKFDHSDENLVTLCRPCHLKIHAGTAALPELGTATV